MVLKANDRRTSCPCHDEFRGPRSDYVRQNSLKQEIFGALHSLLHQELSKASGDVPLGFPVSSFLDSTVWRRQRVKCDTRGTRKRRPIRGEILSIFSCPT
ncbi:hypothetical protein TNCV_2625771 [Trichonephila clavipes]|nr:hypothetical protein TNCV_2625771 [Trichonephila clavipes]